MDTPHSSKRMEGLLRRRHLPSNSDSEGTFRPISPLYDGHFSSHITAWTIEDFMCVTMVCGRSIMRVSMSALVGVGMWHDAVDNSETGKFLIFICFGYWEAFALWEGTWQINSFMACRPPPWLTCKVGPDLSGSRYRIFEKEIVRKRICIKRWDELLK